jgi:hypothetical protein
MSWASDIAVANSSAILARVESLEGVIARLLL